MQRVWAAGAALAAAFLAGAMCAVGLGLGDRGAAAQASARPAYLVVTGVVHDRAAFRDGYAAKLPPLYARHGGRYLAVGAGGEVLEGEGGFSSYVISEWPSVSAAKAFWEDPEYLALRRARSEQGWGEFDVYLFEGLAAPVSTPPILKE